MQQYDFLSGLTSSLTPDFWQQLGAKPLFWVGTESCPTTFFALWRQKVTLLAKVEFKFLGDCLVPGEQKNLALSWLATQQKQAWWVGDLAGYKNLAQVLQTQTGEPLVIFCTPEQLTKLTATQRLDALQISLPKLLTANLINQTVAALGVQLTPPRQQVLQQWSKRFLLTPNLDLLWQLASYVELINPTYFELMPDYLEQLFAAQHKFFLFPQMLFSGQKQAFLQLWTKVEELYPQPFWHVFWVNAFYRAIALKIAPSSSRLLKGFERLATQPFFQQLTIKQLQQVAWQLYRQEHCFKQGLTGGGLTQIFWALWQDLGVGERLETTSLF